MLGKKFKYFPTNIFLIQTNFVCLYIKICSCPDICNILCTWIIVIWVDPFYFMLLCNNFSWNTLILLKFRLSSSFHYAYFFSTFLPHIVDCCSNPKTRYHANQGFKMFYVKLLVTLSISFELKTLPSLPTHDGRYF